MKTLMLFATILALASCVSAQQVIDFDSLPVSATPTAIPENYAGMHWDSIDVVSPAQYPDAGPGFSTGNHVMLAFGGGPLCYPNYGGTNNDGSAFKAICMGRITVGIGPNALPSFHPVSAVIAAGWINGSIVVTAFNNGVQVGQQRYNLTTNASVINFPNGWGQITELMITPGPRGSFVIYTFTIS